MTSGVDAEMLEGQDDARRAASQLRSRLIAGRKLRWALWLLPAAIWLAAGSTPIGQGVAVVIAFAVATWLAYSTDRRIDAVVRRLNDTATPD